MTRTAEDTLVEALSEADAALSAGDLAGARTQLATARELARAGPSRAFRGDVAWRQGVVAHAMALFAEAAAHFEAASESFGLEGAHADEAVARMRLAESAFLATGAADALRAAREAVEAARMAGGGEALLEALALTGELHAELGAHEEALVRFREVLRLAADWESQGQALGVHALRAGVGVVEARLALGEDDKARATLAQLEGVRALAEGPLVGARLAVVEAVLQAAELSLAPDADALPPSVARAAARCHAAMIPVRIPRMLLQIGQRIERAEGHAVALPWFERAAEEARPLADRFRLAPVHFALARSLGAVGRWVEADIAIEEALRRSEEVGDLEGLRLCTELGVHIAVAIEVPNLAARRLVSLARARARGGDGRGRTRALLAAVELARRFGLEDVRGVLEELMGALRETGAAHLGPLELDELARAMGAEGAWDLASEAWQLRAGFAAREGRRTEEARCLFSASHDAFKAGAEEEAVRLMEQAMELARVLGLRELKAWSAGGKLDAGPDEAARPAPVLVR